MNNADVKYQTCNICDAMHRNVNGNFKSISFEILDGGDIQLKFVLYEKLIREEEYIDDLMTEFESMQESNCVLMPIIEVGNGLPLKNIVYQVN